MRNIKGEDMNRFTKNVFQKTLVGATAVFIVSLFVLFLSHPANSQSEKSKQKSLSGVVYVDPIGESVKETVVRIKKSKQLVKLLATPRNKKSTQDLIYQKKLTVKVFNIPIKKKLTVVHKPVPKKKESAKAAVAPAIKKLNPPAAPLKQPMKKTALSKSKKSSSLAETSSKSSKRSTKAQKKIKVAQKSPSNRAGSDFNHLSTGFPLTGAHFRVNCEQCHVGGTFRGTPRRCFFCHRSGGIASSVASVRHIRTDNVCNNCHTTQSWGSVVRVDHNSVSGSCSSCHNSIQAKGKGARHIQSSSQCDSCHTTARWTSARFDHSRVTGTCSSCHNGTTATGKGATHLQSSNTCDDCHVTTSWTNVRFDHAGVTGTCSSCHNGTTATGKNATHIQTSGQCDGCHNNLAWSPVNFDHALVTGSCSNCHNGTTATGKPVNHFITNVQCDECHNTNNWTAINFRHTSAAYPGDHRFGLVCSRCHQSNSQTVIWQSPSYKPDCAGCHANDYKSGPHKKYENPDTPYSVSELRDCTGACHVYTNSTMTTIKERRTGEHRVNGGDF